MAFAALSTSLKIANEAQQRRVVLGETAPAGAVFRKGTGDAAFITDTDTVGEAIAHGVLLNGGEAGQWVNYAPDGAVLTNLAGLTRGQTYYGGGGADEGKVGLFSDVDTANYFGVLVGIALTTSSLKLKLENLAGAAI